MKRVCVVGSGGAGKSTFSQKLSNKINVPVFHLDKIFWKDYWVEREKDEYAQMHAKWIEHDKWIIDGNGYSFIDSRLKRADTIVFLDYSRLVSIPSVIYRALKFHGTSRPMMQENCKEKIDKNFFEFLIYIWNYKSRMRPKILKVINSQQNKNIKIFKNRLEANKWLENLS